MSAKQFIVGAGLAACAWVVVASTVAQAQQPPRFEETLVVTATPKAPEVKGSPDTDYFLTFSAPVGVPHVTLPAGTYLFRFPAPGAKIIQVLKGDSSGEYAMFQAIEVRDTTRDLASKAQIVMWNERQAGAPPAIKTWFLPGKTTGYEFIYPER